MLSRPVCLSFFLSGPVLVLGKLFHNLAVALANGTTYDIAQLINCAVANAVVNKQTLPALLHNALLGQDREVLADISLAHAA